jgi:hypothetical protein
MNLNFLTSNSVDQINNEKARQTLEQILNSSEFTRLRQSVDLRELIARLLVNLSALNIHVGIIETLLKVVVVVAGLVLIIYLSRLVSPFLRFWTANVEEQDILEASFVRPSPSRMLAEAEIKASNGDFRNALRDLYLALLFEMDSRRFIVFKTAKTNWEYLGEIRRNAVALEEYFRAMVDLFDYKWYGMEYCDGADFRRGKELYHALLKEVPHG